MEAILWDFAAFQRTRQFHISQGILLFDTAEGNLNLEFRREPIFILYYDIVLSDIVNIGAPARNDFVIPECLVGSGRATQIRNELTRPALPIYCTPCERSIPGTVKNDAADFKHLSSIPFSLCPWLIQH